MNMNVEEWREDLQDYLRTKMELSPPRGKKQSLTYIHAYGILQFGTKMFF